MNIVLIGLSHKTAPLAMRERLAFAHPQLSDRQLDELIAYFTAMKALKHDAGRAP